MFGQWGGGGSQFSRHSLHLFCSEVNILLLHESSFSIHMFLEMFLSGSFSVWHSTAWHMWQYQSGRAQIRRGHTEVKGLFSRQARQPDLFGMPLMWKLKERSRKKAPVSLTGSGKEWRRSIVPLTWNAGKRLDGWRNTPMVFSLISTCSTSIIWWVLSLPCKSIMSLPYFKTLLIQQTSAISFHHCRVWNLPVPAHLHLVLNAS